MIPISIFVSTSIAIILLALSRQIWSKKNAKQRSLNGISGIKLFIELIKLTQQHRGMHTGFLNGKVEFKDKLISLEKDINQLFTDLLAFEKEHSYPESLSTHFPYKQWQRLLAKHSIQSADSFQLHSGLIARQLDALWDMSDVFSLTSNYQENIRNSAIQLVKTLPELAEALGQIRALSVQVAAKQEISSDKKLQLLFTLGKIEDCHQKLTYPLPQTTDKQLRRFVNDIRKSVNEQELGAQDPDTLFKEATQVIDEIFTVIHSGFTTLKSNICDL